MMECMDILLSDSQAIAAQDGGPPVGGFVVYREVGQMGCFDEPVM